MIHFFLLVIFIAVITFIGWNLVYLMSGKARGLCVLEMIALSYVVGLGLVTMEMLLFYFLKVPLSPTRILIPFAVLLFINAVVNIFVFPNGFAKKPCCKKDEGRSGVMAIFLMVGIAFEVAYAFFRALIKPIESYDAIAIYAVKAKMLYLSKAINSEFFIAIKAFPHPDYPLNIPFAETFLYMCMRDLDDVMVKAIFPLFFTAALAILYYAIRRFATKTYALVFVFILATIPQFNSYAANAYHELPLACYYLASAVLLLRWFGDTSLTRYLPLSAVLVGFAAWTKNEGLLYCVVNMAVLAVFIARNFDKIKIKNLFFAAAYPVIIVLMMLPWVIIKRTYGITNSEINLVNINIQYLIAQVHKLMPIAYEFQKQFFGPKRWNIFWPAALTIAVIFYRRATSGLAGYIALSITLAVAGYVLFYLISYVDVVYFLSKTWSRFLLHFLPVAVLWIAMILKDELKV